MNNHFVIAGLGLLGGSLSLALKRRDPECRIHVLGRDPERLETARREGFCDSWSVDSKSLPAGIRGAFVCTTVEKIPEIALELLSVLPQECFVTDVGSTKAGIVQRLAGDQLAAGRFVGSHPMAGSEKSGYRNASPDLFQDATVVVTPAGGTRPDLLERVRMLWTGLGARVVMMDAELHDRIVGMTSHLPHILSFTFAATLGWGKTAIGDYHRVWGNGLRDMIRLAGSDPALWSGILMENRSAILEALNGYRKELETFSRLLKAGEQNACTGYLEKCRTEMEAICEPNR